MIHGDDDDDDLYLSLNEENINTRKSPVPSFHRRKACCVLSCFFGTIIVIIISLVAVGTSEINRWVPYFDPFGSVNATLTNYTSGEFSCVQLMNGYDRRIKSYDVIDTGSHLNSITNVHPLLSDRATQLDEYYNDNDALVGKLHCIPIVVKDTYGHLDFPITAGSAALSDCFPAYFSPVIHALQSEGAIIIAKTNLPDFTVGDDVNPGSNSSLIGATSHAYTPTRSPYGSSGGTAVAVSAGLAVAGLGADTNGGIILPAAANGMVGLRPTQGLVSSDGCVPMTQGKFKPFFLLHNNHPGITPIHYCASIRLILDLCVVLFRSRC